MRWSSRMADPYRPLTPYTTPVDSTDDFTNKTPEFPAFGVGHAVLNGINVVLDGNSTGSSRAAISRRTWRSC